MKPIFSARKGQSEQPLALTGRKGFVALRVHGRQLLIRPRFFLSLLILAWGIGTALVFLRLEERSRQEVDRLATALSTRFNVSWVSRPDDDGNRHLFRSLKHEYFGDFTQNLPLFKAAYLTWVHSKTGKEVLIYPPRLIGRDIQDLQNADTIRKPLIDPFRQPVAASGYLYFQMDPWQKSATPTMFLLAALNVLLLFLILFYWLSSLTRRYEATQVELEKKKAELIYLEQLALAGKLSAGLLHDLKKPVIHIREECRDGLDSETLKDIHEQSELFLGMLRDSGLEDFARRRSSVHEYCDVIDLIERSLRLVEYERNEVEVELKSEENLPFVWALPTRLIQVFSNLILNACQIQKGKGKLLIDIDTIEIGGARHPRIRIRDFGPGIPPEHLSKIFDPFFNSGKEGSGLGLYIARTIIEDYSGSIEAENCPDGGAVFTVILPAESTRSH